MLRDIEVNDSSSVVRDHKEEVQRTKVSVGTVKNPLRKLPHDGDSEMLSIALRALGFEALSASSATQFAPKYQNRVSSTHHESAAHPRLSSRQPCER
jgi:hypothetical protein